MKLNSRSILNIVFMGIGIFALVLLIREITLERLLSQLADVGSTFILILLIELLSNLASSRGWYFSFQPKYRPSYWFVSLTQMASLSLAGALPTGQASEVVKANLIRGRSPNTEIVSSLIWYNYLHVLTTSAMVFVAIIIPIIYSTFELSISIIFLAVATIYFVVVLVIAVLLRMGLLGKVLLWLRSKNISWLSPSNKTLRGAEIVDQRLKGFISDHRSDFIRGLLWLFIGRLFNILEVWLILTSLGLPHALPIALMIYAATSLANYILMILPAREGFLEGSAYLIFELLKMDPASGLSMEIVRRLRKIFFQIVGIFLIFVLSKNQNTKNVLSADDFEE